LIDQEGRFESGGSTVPSGNWTISESG